MKKRLAKLVIVAAVLVGATAPVSAVSICDLEPTSFNVWFLQHMLRC
jgi:hypothetical protein